MMPSVTRLGSQTYSFPMDMNHEDDGTWSVVFSDLPGCVTWGTTRMEALANAHEAATLHLEGLREHGDAIPEPSLAHNTQEVGFFS